MTFFFDKRLNLTSDIVMGKAQQDFFDALHTLDGDTAKLSVYPESVLKLFPKSINPLVRSYNAWDKIFELSESNEFYYKY